MCIDRYNILCGNNMFALYVSWRCSLPFKSEFLFTLSENAILPFTVSSNDNLDNI